MYMYMVENLHSVIFVNFLQQVSKRRNYAAIDVAKEKAELAQRRRALLVVRKCVCMELEY